MPLLIFSKLVLIWTAAKSGKPAESVEQPNRWIGFSCFSKKNRASSVPIGKQMPPCITFIDGWPHAIIYQGLLHWCEWCKIMYGNSLGKGISFEKCFIDMLQCREIIFVFLVLLMYFAKFYCKLYNLPLLFSFVICRLYNFINFYGNYFNKMMMILCAWELNHQAALEPYRLTWTFLCLSRNKYGWWYWNWWWFLEKQHW